MSEEIQQQCPEKSSSDKLQGFSPDSDLFGATWGPGASLEQPKGPETASCLPNLSIAGFGSNEQLPKCSDPVLGMVSDSEGRAVCSLNGDTPADTPKANGGQAGGADHKSKSDSAPDDAQPQQGDKKSPEPGLMDKIRKYLRGPSDGAPAPRFQDLPPMP